MIVSEGIQPYGICGNAQSGNVQQLDQEIASFGERDTCNCIRIMQCRRFPVVGPNIFSANLLQKKYPKTRIQMPARNVIISGIHSESYDTS
ncbi:hypothetical protein Mlab_0178 [Methanocorpusculum labreanum Z]|uniref:Uncharacterized protein n=1 Tax=Methanocorpusculum labreanum (strain ATCC 43576 / DSM 4855 / Z) TaxID=410358 RepID=A2SPU8_METLZ|nr:hypothetical protein Mlab_0178 [Methanocorpusculum labreanum Z]